MIKVQFITEEFDNKSTLTKRARSNPVYFDKYDETVELLIKVQQQKLAVTLKNCRVLCLIENVEENL